MVRSYWLLSELVPVGVRSLIHIGWQSSDAKCKELGGHDIFGPPPEIPARKLTAAHNLELKANRDMEEPAPLRNLCTSVKVSYVSLTSLNLSCGGKASILYIILISFSVSIYNNIRHTYPCKEFEVDPLNSSESEEGGGLIAPQEVFNRFADVVQEAIKKMKMMEEEKLRMVKKARLAVEAYDQELKDKAREVVALKMDRQRKKQ
ncbi:hypothetical protein POM88_010607 [Heracleum sosnowskyi]|uniref:DUF4057 domain-containing protein n=1 Tax=Heracleum sosnowskyi TaxID=360622 RepID=A0AAD8ITT7_9APIA|nr:hypothetical protein POM88_010607 [Heracleum sosnowskyi]